MPTKDKLREMLAGQAREFQHAGGEVVLYAWQRPPLAREMANRRLSKGNRTTHHELNGIYGHRRIKAELAAMGHACGAAEAEGVL